MDDPYLDFCCSQPANLPRVLEKRWKIPVNFPEMYRFPIYIYIDSARSTTARTPILMS